MNQADWILDLIRKSEFATGADFSHHKGTWTLDDIDMERFCEVMDFAILRAGYGAQNGGIYKDRNFEVNYQTADKHRKQDKIEGKEHGLLIGVYWYFSSHSPWEDQYSAFMLFCEGKEFDFYVLDFEQMYNEKTAGFAITALRFMKKLHNETGRKVLLYCNKYTYVDWIYKFTKEVNNFPMWIAQYPWQNWTSGLTEWFKAWWTAVFAKLERRPAMPSVRPSDDWEIWQVISASGIGNELGFSSEELDFNVTRRKKADFYAWIGKKVEPPKPTEPPTDCSKEERAGYMRAWHEIELLAKAKQEGL